MEVPVKFFTLALIFLLVTLSSADSRMCSSNDMTEWFGKALRELDTVHNGMTRADLAKVFKPEGGFSSARLQSGTYIYRESPYIKVDVEFSLAAGKESGMQSPNDIITSISRPYVGYPVYD